ncbi:MAG: Gfo/Idh/MocA family oxidoreductase [Ruminococcaceae bacterium]|nr:Gfo/Idh/MocA family oxidoreductase [Oscillospiraceae bacterium]
MNIGIIGTGRRSAAYVELINSNKYENVKITALADSKSENLEGCKNLYFKDKEVSCYDNYIDLLNDKNVDAIIICTPDTTHREIAINAIKYDKHILLEKPIATTAEDAKAIYFACKDYKKTICLGFVLRYTQFYRKIKSIIDNGDIGEVISIEAKEMLNYTHASSFYRRWHRDSSTNGGLLNAKCSHDLDILCWLAGKNPEYVSSFGGCTHFVENEKASDICDNCKIKDSCIYDYNTIDYGCLAPVDNNCVYNCKKDIIDHQVLNIQFGNNVTASFTLSLLSAYENRSIMIFGTKGTISGDFNARTITVKDLRPDSAITYHLPEQQWGHNGGDSGIMADFIKSACSDKPINDVKSGYLSSILALNADISRKTKKIVPIEL